MQARRKAPLETFAAITAIGLCGPHRRSIWRPQSPPRAVPSARYTPRALGSMTTSRAASATDIAWQELEVTAREGKNGILSDVAFVQGVNRHIEWSKAAAQEGAFRSAL